MAITYSIDEEQGLVYSEFSETIRMDDFHTYFSDLRGNQAFRSDFAGICDWRKVHNISVEYQGMQTVTSECPWGRDSYRAIVVSNPVGFGMSRMFQSISDESHGTIQIFKGMHEAEAWLNSVRLH